MWSRRQLLTGAVVAPLLLSACGRNDAKLLGMASIPDAAGEWWCTPLVSYQSKPYSRTVFGAISTEGMVLVGERNHDTGQLRRIELEPALPDDHCVPAVWVKHGHRTVVMWTWHSADGVIRARVSDPSGDVATLASAPTQTFASADHDVSYTAIVHRTAASTPDSDAFWLFTRRAQKSWEVIPFEVDTATGVISWGAEIVLFVANGISGRNHQLYTTIADDYAELTTKGANQRIRCVCVPNPSDRVGDGFDHAVWYTEIDVVTGALVSPDNPSLTANLLTGLNLPIDLPSIAPRIPDAPFSSRRVFGVRAGPDPPAIALAEWTLANPDGAAYTVHECGDRVPARHNGLIPANGGFASAPSSTALQVTTGLIVKDDFLLPNVATPVYTSRKYAGSSTGLYFIRVESSGAVTVFVGTDTSTNAYTTRETPLAALWGSRVQLRVSINPAESSHPFGDGVGVVAGRSVLVEYATDGGSTWATGGVMSMLSAPTSLKPSTDDLNIPSLGLAGAMQCIFSSRLLDRDATQLSYVDFESAWHASAKSYTDPEGNVWTLAPPAVIGRTDPAMVAYDWTDRTYGPSGPRFGFTSTSNYLGGLGFDSPSRERRLFVASSDGTTDTLTRYDRGDSRTDIPTTLVSQPTIDGRLARPYPPISPRDEVPYDVLYNRITHYGDSYTDYEMSNEAR